MDATKREKWKTLCVDFDGVIHAYTSGWKGVDVIPDGPTPGAIRWLFWAIERYNVCVYSSRSKDNKGLTAMRSVIESWALLEGCPRGEVAHLMNVLKFPTQKPAAWLTIDDRAICFDGQWPTAKQIDEFRPWFKRG